MIHLKPQATSQGPAGNLLRGQLGMALQSDGAWGRNPVLRGLKRESVVVMVDGFRVNSAQPQGPSCRLNINYRYAFNGHLN
ncbi:MAG TPA: hypothetical protein VJY83_13200 [Thiopseudomonas sp.]|nr:hypothetical protein [Thiopseudomonas sp.]